MESVPDGALLSPDWVTRVTPHHVGLTGAEPVSAYIPEPLPRGTMRIDVHQGLEVGVVLTGRHVRRFEDFVMALDPGDVWLCAMWEPHGWHVISERGSSLGIVFLPEFLGEERFDGVSWLSIFALPPAVRPRVETSKARSSILALGEELGGEFASKRAGWMTAVRLGVLRILFLLSREWRHPSPARVWSSLYASDLGRIMPALRLLHNDPPKAVRLSEAAQVSGLCAAHFGRVFLKTMGMSFQRFCMRARLAWVANRLLTTNLPIEAVAADAGFVDGSHLIHTFAKHYGCTPGEYRRQALSPPTGKT